MKKLRWGVLGAAWIAPLALLRPAKDIPQLEVAAVAARDPARAAKFAAQHGIPRVHGTYAELLADPDLDVVYNPLPNSLHVEWTIRALEAGKHVLCEKPLGLNVAECERMAEAATRTGRVLAEAMHYCYHPLYQQARTLVGGLGKLERFEAYACFPIFRNSDIRYSYALGGGATMDLGCYAIHMARFLTGEEPRVAAATARLHRPDVDRWMRAELEFPSGAHGRITCSMWSVDFLRWEAQVVGNAGELKATPNELVWSEHGARQRQKFPEARSTYYYQLVAFQDAVLLGKPLLTTPADAIANQRIIDDAYRQAGLALRGAR